MTHRPRTHRTTSRGDEIHRGAHPDDRSERGSVSTEFALVMVTFVISFLLLVLYAGRVAQADNEVRNAAHAGARAATLEPTAGAARAKAEAVVRTNLASSNLACQGGARPSVNVGSFQPGEFVTVSIACTVKVSDLADLGVPGTTTFRYTAREIIDVYRSER